MLYMASHDIANTLSRDRLTDRLTRVSGGIYDASWARQDHSKLQGHGPKSDSDERGLGLREERRLHPVSECLDP